MRHLLSSIALLAKTATTLNEYGQSYVWDFDPREGAWVFQPCVTNAHADHWLRENMDIHRWTARSKDDVMELEEYLKQRLGID